MSWRDWFREKIKEQITPAQEQQGSVIKLKSELEEVLENQEV